MQVRGVNDSGDGLWSDTATGTPTTDEAPTIDSVTPGDRSIAVEWTAPTNASLGTVTAYDLRYIRSDAPDRADSNWTVLTAVWTSGSLEYTLNPTTTPLVNGVSYDVQVRAVVGSVQHPWAGVRAAMPRTTPGAPAIDSVRAGDLSLTAEWSAPASDGGADITSYDVRHIRSDAADKADDHWTVMDDAWTSASGALEYTVSGLTNDVEYDVQVRAVNAAGDGLWSATGTGTPRTPPGAPEAVQVYVYTTGRLEVRWTATETDTVTSFNVQWRSGAEEWSGDRSTESDPASARVEWWPRPGTLRYHQTLEGLTDGTEYEVRVTGSNQGAYGEPSQVATATPESAPTREQAAAFVENELINIYEDQSSWLRVAFVQMNNSPSTPDSHNPYKRPGGIDFNPDAPFSGQVFHTCYNASGTELEPVTAVWERFARFCRITGMRIQMEYSNIIPLVTHELAHVLTLTNRLDGSPEAELAIARLYFAEVDHGCDYRPAREVLADLIMVTVFGDAGLGETGYWQHCVSRDTEEALEVVRTALAGEMPAWLADTYGDENGDLDLERVWSDIKAEGDSSPVMRDLMRTAFGGLCRSDALWNNAIRIPWRDGGCVPQAPPGLTAVPAVDGIMALSWESPDDDGGSRITGYTVQWKSGAQEYDTSRQAPVTDPADLSHTIEGLSHGVGYTIRVLAHNINGDGAASEVNKTAVGAEAALGTLTLAGVTLYPAFSSTTTSYEAVTGHAPTQITIAATAADADASVAFLDVAGITLTDAGAGDGFQVNLSVGANVIQVRVTAQDSVAATYTVTVTRAEENTSLSPPASDPVAASPSSATYTITFRGHWTTDVTPEGLPGGAHFSPLIGGVHGAGVTFLERGGTASAGIESMAEIGGAGTLRSEVQAAINATPPTALSVLRRSGNIGSTGSDTLSNVTLSTQYPRVTLTTMIAPSHDWFVGVSGMPLLNGQGEWLSWVRVFLYPWDAGTEEGNDFSLSPSVNTSPRGVIHSIRGTGKFTAERIASLTFTLQALRTERSLVENTPAGVAIGPTVPAATSSGTVTHTLGGRDAASFDLDASTGQLRTKQGVTYDHETRDRYTVTVTATDSDGSIVTTVDISVADVDEPPTVNGQSAVEFAENRTGTVASYRTSDPEGERVTWLPLSGADGSAFDLSDGGALTFRLPPDHEAQDEYQLTLRASDGGLTGTLGVTVTVTNVDEPPEVMGEPHHTIEENSTDYVGHFVATDPEGVAPSWTALSGPDRGHFELEDSGDLSFTAVPDYDARADADRDNVYEVTVGASDGGKTGTLAVTVTVTNVNEPPVIAGPDSVDFVEHGAGIIATYTATDPEDATIGWIVTYSPFIGVRFTIDPHGVLRFSAPPDYETGPSQYTLTVHASDGPNADDLSVTINVINLEEAGTVTLSSEQPQVGARLTATLTDPDGSIGNESWIWERSPNRSTWAEISDETAQSYTPADADLNHYLRVTVEYTDGHGAGKRLREASDQRTQEPPPVNHAPEFSDARAERSIDENAPAGTAVGARVTATDPENDQLTYALSGSVDSFTVDDSTGQIRVADGATLDHEEPSSNSYFVTVTATDPSNASDSISVDITVTDVNEAPNPTDDAATTDEDVAVNIRVLTNDKDPEGDALSVRLRSRPRNGSATVDATTNEVTYTPNAHYHGADSFTYTVSDGGLTSRQATVNVTVNSVNDPPVFPAATTTRSVSQNAQPGANVGQPLTATDADGDVLTYSLTGVAASDFEIEEHTGQVTLRQGTVLDPETQPSYTGTATVTDPSSASATTDLTITVTAVAQRTSGGGGGGGGGAQVNRDPEFVDGQRTTRRVPEDTPVGGAFGDPVTATDDDDDTLTYTLRGDDAGSFTIDGRTGQLSAKAPLDYESRANYRMEVRVADGEGGDDAIRVTVSVTNVNEPPLISGPVAMEYEENGEDAVATYAAADPEGGEVLAWALAGDDTGLFSISTVGELSFDDPPDYETPSDDDGDNVYRVTVQATDASDVTGTLEIAITVTDGDDGGIVGRYDMDGDDVIDRGEALAAVSDYFADLITKSEAIEVVTHYFIG